MAEEDPSWDPFADDEDPAGIPWPCDPDRDAPSREGAA